MNLHKSVLAISLLLALPGVTSAIAATSAPAAAVNVRHAQPITLRQTTIGEGMPKVIIPTTGATADQVLAQAKVIGANPDAA